VAIEEENKKEIKKNAQKLVPVALFSLFHPIVDIAQQPLHGSLRKFVDIFRSYRGEK